jgi:hypothetical protein
MKSKQIFCSGLGVFFAILAVLTASAFAAGNDNVGNLYFSINIPDSWTYLESSNTPQSRTTGYGPVNAIQLTPSEFGDVLLGLTENTEHRAVGGVMADFFQDTDYRLKNAPLESYVKYLIDKFGIINITSQQYTTVGKEKSVRISANESAQFGYGPIVLYVVMHDKVPYHMEYIGSTESPNYQKYLPKFEKMVKSFRFADSVSSEGTGNLTNTKTNFSDANANLNRPYLGIIGLSLTSDLSKQIGLNQTKGFLLTSITKDSPADKYGLRGGSNTTSYKGRDIAIGGDIILKMDDREISKIDDIMKYLQSQKHAGDKVLFTILRDNGIKELDVILGQSPSPPLNDYSNTPSSQYGTSHEELYDECVRTAGKSLCDFLFKR